MVVLPCIPKVYLIKITPMKILTSLILSFILIGLWSCSDNGKIPVSSETEVECTSDLDCAGECDGDAVEDTCGVCNGDGSTCNISYSTTIQPIFNNNCTGCHGSSGGLNLGSYSTLNNGGTSGAVIIAENGSGSRLIQKLRGTASGSQMPASGCCLDASVIQLIETWIDEGAENN
jgi:hypothetical protein